MKPLICDIPYPSVEELTKDIRSGQILSFAYATADGELTATLQYVYQSMLDTENGEFADTMMSIALAEMKHFRILGAAMAKLGVNPTITKRPCGNVPYDSACVSRQTEVKRMLYADLKSELEAIGQYQKMLFVLQNEQVKAIVERLILDEKLHFDTIKRLWEQAP